MSWSRDGQWVIIASAHDYIHSRNNERNIFVMRPDGSGLRMVTGDYVDPQDSNWSRLLRFGARWKGAKEAASSALKERRTL